MANLSKLKRPNSLGAPPPADEASQNLTAPEVAPRASTPPGDPRISGKQKANAVRTRPENTNEQPDRVDGRSLRKSGRLIPFATRVSLDFDTRLRRIAQRDGLLLVEVLECGLDAYEASGEQLSA
jgi:hypothetical protein